MAKFVNNRREAEDIVRNKYGITQSAAEKAISYANDIPDGYVQKKPMVIISSMGVREEQNYPKNPYDEVVPFKDTNGNRIYKVPDIQYGTENSPLLAVVNPTKNINKIYSDDGGFKSLMGARQSSPNYPYYDKMAKAIYDNSAKFAGQSWNYDNVKNYNDRMSHVEPDRNVLVRDKWDRGYGGSYNPLNDVVTVSVGGIEDTNPLARHEIVHSAQGMPKYTDILGIPRLIKDAAKGEWNYIIDNALYQKSDKYNTSPTELHANIAGVSQALRSSGVPLKTENDIDNYLDSFINDDGTDAPEVRNLDENGKVISPYKNQHAVYAATGILMRTMRHNKIIQQGISKGIPLKKIMKALIMTTAKNNEQIPQQPNGVFDNGFNIS